MKRILRHIEKHPALLFFIVGAIVLVIVRVLGFDGLYGQDAYEYARYTGELQESLLASKTPEPFFWPIYYPIFGMVVNFIFNDLTWSMQLVSLLSWTLTLLFSYQLITSLYTPKNKWTPLLYVLFFIGFSPYFLRLGVSGMSDALCTLFVVFTFLFSLKKELLKYVHFVFLFAALAVFTRYGAVMLIIPPVFVTFYKIVKNKKYIQALFSISLAALVTVPFLVLQGFSPTETVSSSVISDWSFGNMFSTHFTSNEGSFEYPFPNIIYSLYAFFHPAFFFIGIGLIVTSAYFKIKINKLILGSVLVYCLLIAGIHFQNKRFLILCLPLVVILLFPAYEKLMSLKLLQKYKVLLLTTFGITSIILSGYSFHKLNTIHQEEMRLIKLLEPYQEHSVYTFDIDIAMQGKNLQFQYHNLWLTKDIAPKSGDLILLNYDKWSTQWEGHQLMDNCNYIFENPQLKLLKDLENGWLLYRY